MDNEKVTDVKDVTQNMKECLNQKQNVFEKTFTGYQRLSIKKENTFAKRSVYLINFRTVGSFFGACSSKMSSIR